MNTSAPTTIMLRAAAALILAASLAGAAQAAKQHTGTLPAVQHPTTGATHGFEYGGRSASGGKTRGFEYGGKTATSGATHGFEYGGLHAHGASHPRKPG